MTPQTFCSQYLLLPYMTTMINASLRDGRLPSTQKHAVVTPLLKKAGLDTSDLLLTCILSSKSLLDTDELKNYRPVSNLTFVSKLVERVVSS